MADTPAPEYLRFVAEERRAQRLAAEQPALAVGASASQPITVSGEQVTALLRVAAKRAAGFFRPTTHTEVVWVHGDSELAVNLVSIATKIDNGLITITIPVRCDQTGATSVDVYFAVGSPDQPAGLYASTLRRPSGPALVVSVWGDALVAFAWQCVLELVSGLAGATGKDTRGNVLVPVEMSASQKGLQIFPMARWRFSGSSGLKTPVNAIIMQPGNIDGPLPKPTAKKRHK